MTSNPHRWRILAVVATAFFMTILDVSIVNVALPSISRALDFSRENLQWVITAYSIAFGGFLLLAGRAADLLGRRRVFMVGVALFTLASLVCGLAQSEGMLIAARAVQGLGGAIITPAALSIVMTSFEEGAERNKALGIWGALGGSGAAVGVLAGGVLTKYLGWEWIFFVNVPVGALVLVLTPRIVPESRREGAERSYDVLGAVLVSGGLALFVYTISRAPDVGWGSARTILLLIASGALLVGFLVNERRVHDPLMPFHIFRVRTVAGANVVGALLGAVIFANFFLLTLYVQNVLGYSALKTGVTFVATAGTAVARRRGRAGLDDEVRAEADHRDRPRSTHGRDDLVRPDPGTWELRVRPAARLRDGRRRDRVRVRPRLDRRARGCRGARGRTGLRADQHVTADRRRGRNCGCVDDLHDPLQVASPRRQVAAGGVDQRLQLGLLRPGRVRRRWRSSRRSRWSAARTCQRRRPQRRSRS